VIFAFFVNTKFYGLVYLFVLAKKSGSCSFNLNMPVTEDSQAACAKSWKTGWLVTSIVIQQLLFFALQGLVIKLLDISAWVEYAPIWMLWALYFVAPFVYVRPITRRAVFQCYAKAGWFFVIAALGWFVAYNILCSKYGIPVSWDDVQHRYYQSERAAEKASGR
jgi:hypothetical protein